MSDTGIYVYGLVAAGALPSAPGVEGIDGEHGVELLQHGEICALISRVDLDQFGDSELRANLSDIGWVEQTARSHQRVLDHVTERCTPIPMRMCTLYGDERGLRTMLTRDHDKLAAGLRELDSRLEWGVKAFALPSSGTAGVTAAASGSAAASGPSAATGTAYLQSRLAQRSAGAQRLADLEQACDEVHSELTAVATAARLNALQRPEVSGRDASMVINASYLVANDRREDFCRRVAALGEQMPERGLELELTGPWPPYNFVPASIGGGL
jgi:hypothetical protein